MGSNMPHRRIAIVVPATIMKLQLLVDLQSMKIEIVKMRTILIKMELFITTCTRRTVEERKSVTTDVAPHRNCKVSTASVVRDR